ncbi:DinB family protein [Niabella ginsengisoli]|uniref:Damage-inducible protein DinB n=1 Tax=Niabella ginsengisoli TaxID=522298 RepID=A0ABS9SK61_9BACT|nr:DinB family protein [Niabella ginsengisoli]MCH5598777.1 hypothetical protein [Niabella ginsengisoli]
MKQFFKELFEYNHFCNQKLWNFLNVNSDKSLETPIKLYSHILNAHQIWNNRIAFKQASFGIWEIHPAQNWKGIEQINFNHSLLIIEEFNLDNPINYANTKGQIFNQCIKDILFHVINHSTYHRGQIATNLRQSGLEPLVTDYILYKM